MYLRAFICIIALALTGCATTSRFYEEYAKTPKRPLNIMLEAKPVDRYSVPTEAPTQVGIGLPVFQLINGVLSTIAQSQLEDRQRSLNEAARTAGLDSSELNHLFGAKLLLALEAENRKITSTPIEFTNPSLLGGGRSFSKPIVPQSLDPSALHLAVRVDFGTCTTVRISPCMRVTAFRFSEKIQAGGSSSPNALAPPNQTAFGDSNLIPQLMLSEIYYAKSASTKDQAGQPTYISFESTEAAKENIRELDKHFQDMIDEAVRYFVFQLSNPKKSSAP